MFLNLNEEDPKSTALSVAGDIEASKLYPLDAPAKAKALDECVNVTSPALKLITAPDAKKRSDQPSNTAVENVRVSPPDKKQLELGETFADCTLIPEIVTLFVPSPERSEDDPDTLLTLKPVVKTETLEKGAEADPEALDRLIELELFEVIVAINDEI